MTNKRGKFPIRSKEFTRNFSTTKSLKVEPMSGLVFATATTTTSTIFVLSPCCFLVFYIMLLYHINGGEQVDPSLICQNLQHEISISSPIVQPFLDLVQEVRTNGGWSNITVYKLNMLYPEILKHIELSVRAFAMRATYPQHQELRAILEQVDYIHIIHFTPLADLISPILTGDQRSQLSTKIIESEDFLTDAGDYYSWIAEGFVAIGQTPFF